MWSFLLHLMHRKSFHDCTYYLYLSLLRSISTEADLGLLAATSKMECFVIIVNGLKFSILDVAAALDPPLSLSTQYLLNVNNRHISVLNTTLFLSFNSFDNLVVFARPCHYKINSVYRNNITTAQRDRTLIINRDNFSISGQRSTQPIQPVQMISFISIHRQTYTMIFHLLRSKYKMHSVIAVLHLLTSLSVSFISYRN